MKSLCASLLASVIFTPLSLAQTIEKDYAQVNHWNIIAEYENKQFLGCFAWKQNYANQNGFGSVLRIGISDQLKILATDYKLPSASQLTTLTIDNANYQSTFLQFNQWAGMQLSADTLQALKQGNQVNFNFDPSGPVFPLAGSYAAVLKTQECDTYLGVAPQNQAAVTASSHSHCPNNDRKLPESGLCMGEARKLLDSHTDPHPAADNGCSWEVNETAMPGGEFLLYNAYRCKDTTAKLAFQGGAKFATLAVSESAFFGNAAKGTELVTIGSINNNSVIESVLNYVRSQMAPNEKNNQCSVQSGQAYNLPANSYVVNIEKSLSSTADTPEMDAYCGNWGYFSDSYSLWRVFGGFTWFFDFGQDVSEFDPASFSLITQNGHGQWQVVK